GIPGIESSDGQACCAASCSQCGGVGCSSVGDARDCCVTDIVELGEPCSMKNQAPCYIDSGVFPAPTPEPVVDPTFGPVMTSSAPSSAPTSAAPTADG
ncbi:unnamed protein product, partial [Scytosiphon promiscuus]